LKQNRLPQNYSIKNIIDSILQDNKKIAGLSPTRKKKLYKKSFKLLQKCSELKDLISLSQIRNYSYESSKTLPGSDFFSPK